MQHPIGLIWSGYDYISLIQKTAQAAIVADVLLDFSGAEVQWWTVFGIHWLFAQLCNHRSVIYRPGMELFSTMPEHCTVLNQCFGGSDAIKYKHNFFLLHVATFILLQ